MPTESFSINVIEPSITRVIKNQKTTLVRRSETIDDWAGALTAGGWTYEDSLHAWVKLYINAENLPVRSPEPEEGEEKLDGAVICTGGPAIVVQSPDGIYKAWGYDPGAYEEPPCPNFQFGYSSGETFMNWLTKLDSALGSMVVGPITPTGGGYVEIRFDDDAGGPWMNGLQISGWASGTVWYGGYRYNSGMYRGHFMTIEAIEGPGQYDQQHNALEFTLKIDGSFPLKLHLALLKARDSYPYRMCVCPYQFAIWPDKYGDGGGNSMGPFPRSIFIAMPWVDDFYTGHTNFVFALSGILANFRSKMEWDGYVWLNDGPWTGNTGRRIIVPVLRTRGSLERITTTQGFLIMDNAYVTTPPADAEPFIIFHRLAGKLWNCCTLSDHYPPTTVLGKMLGASWVHLSSESYGEVYPYNFGDQKASVWWRVNSASEAA